MRPTTHITIPIEEATTTQIEEQIRRCDAYLAKHGREWGSETWANVASVLRAELRRRAALGEGTGWGCRECGAPRATEQGGRCRTCEKYGETP